MKEQETMPESEKTKQCRECGETKLLHQFSKHKHGKDGHINYCKTCKKEYFSKYKELNKDKIILASKTWRENNKEKLIQYRAEHKQYYKDYSKIYNSSHIEEHKLYHKKYNKLNKTKNSEYHRKKYIEDPKKNYNSVLKSRDKNREKYIESRKKYNRKRSIDNINGFRLKRSLRCTISGSFKRKRYKKNSKTVEILGCSFEFFKQYIENKFESWMNWDNHGKYNGELNYGWDLDHIIPTSSATTEEEIIKLNHYTNFQPLCSKINRDIKKDKLDYYD